MTKELLVSTLHEIVEKTHSDRAYVPGAELISGDALASVADFISNNLEEIKHAQWIGEADGYADGELVYDMWYCSNCDYCEDNDEMPWYNYCPSCGAKIDKSENKKL